MLKSQKCEYLIYYESYSLDISNDHSLQNNGGNSVSDFFYSNPSFYFMQCSNIF